MLSIIIVYLWLVLGYLMHLVIRALFREHRRRRRREPAKMIVLHDFRDPRDL